MLLRDSLIDLTSTPYFNNNLNKYARGIIAVISYLIDEYSAISPHISRKVCEIIWNATKYLRGSISTEIPYEVEYALNLALDDWLKNKTLITTALLNDRSYHFCPLDTWKAIKVLLPEFKDHDFDRLLIQIALPRIYKHKPLYYVPLYHELGHFIDEHFSISETTFLELPAPQGANTKETAYFKYVNTNYRKEFFADLFASCYVGHSNYKFLNQIDPVSLPSDTHPPTAIRVKVAQDFLDNKSNDIVDLFQNALLKLGLQKLEIKYSIPLLNTYFDNLRPYEIRSDKEVHGIFEASWDYFNMAVARSSSPWSQVDEFDISRIINDLTEKSIRNKVITEKWKNAIIN